MKGIKKMFAVFLYLCLIAALMEFDIRKLIDVRQILLVILGMVILYVPNYIEQEHKTIRPEILGGNALWAGVLQTFILLFILLSETESIENLFPKIALMCRPLLYGFCIWQILDGKTEHHEENGVPKEAKEKTASPPVPKEYTATELAEGLHMLGLSKREVEVAVLVTKGMSNAEIAVALCISETTVKKHISNIFKKLEITNRDEVFAKVLDFYENQDQQT